MHPVRMSRTVMFTAPHQCLMMVPGFSPQQTFNPASLKAITPDQTSQYGLAGVNGVAALRPSTLSTMLVPLWV